MPTLITRVEDATPSWITSVLREAGYDHADVREITFGANDAFNSTVAHLTLHYTDDATQAPRYLLLKLNHGGDGELEVGFYLLSARLGIDLPTVRCYAAHYDADSGDSFCVLEDVSATHALPVTRAQVLAGAGVPSDADLASIVDALAWFHARWWQHPTLGQISDLTEVRPWFRDEACYRRHVERRQDEWQRFVAAQGENISDHMREVYERTLAAFPSLWERRLKDRVLSFRHITLTHGDCYFNQWLCPRSNEGSALLVDFQSASANFAAYDLAYLFPTFWTTAQRHEGGREIRLLERYHQGLVAHGVRDYPFELLLADYRLMVTYMIFDPVWDQCSGAGRDYWWPKMNNLVAAFDDLGCMDHVVDA